MAAEDAGMRILLLMRHAKSSWDRSDLADVDRPLAPRGRKAAPLIARYLGEQHLIPDLVLCSHAARVRETWQLMAPVLGDAIACRTLRSLYLAAPSRLLEPLRRTADEVRILMLIGHNPGLGGLAASLAGTGPKKALQRLRTKFPTAGLAVLSFEIERWTELAAGGGRLEDFIRPRDFG
jgi:phosphohistidine phosphatase